MGIKIGSGSKAPSRSFAALNQEKYNQKHGKPVIVDESDTEDEIVVEDEPTAAGGIDPPRRLRGSNSAIVPVANIITSTAAADISNPSATDKRIRMRTDISEELYTRFRVHVSRENTTARQVIEDWIRKYTEP